MINPEGGGSMRAAILVVAVGLAGCGEDDGSLGASATSPLSEAERTEACGALCEHEATCGVDQGECLEWCDGMVRVMRADAARSLLACYSAIECDESSEGGCLGDVIDETTPSEAFGVANGACHAAQTRCQDWYGCDVTFFRLLSDQTLYEVTACFDLPCDQVSDCLDAAL
jgi:hypothetical protein